MRTYLLGSPNWRDAWLVAALGLVLRLVAVINLGTTFPPAADGEFYHVVAGRIADGQGYTWLWPDGTVTFAAHYPVGYPAMIGALYWVFGASFTVAQVFNALLGAVAVLATYWVAAEFGSRRGSCLAAVVAATHPSLVLYTLALMTEGVVAALLVCATALALGASRRRGVGWLVGLGLVLGLGTLVRPQTLLMAPVLGALSVRQRDESGSLVKWPGRWTSVGVRAVGVTALALAVCLPWTLRNCQRMDRCMLVSANAGWNLLIGTAAEGNGAWVSVDEMGVPEPCRTVFGEAQKDACFERAAWDRIVGDPLEWVMSMPAKARATFDYPAAPAHYLAMANPEQFGATSRSRLGLAETIWQRILLAVVCIGLAWGVEWRSRWRRVCAIVGVASLLTKTAVLAVLALAALALGFPRSRPGFRAVQAAAWLLLETLLMHAVFFGAGRYALVLGYLLAAATATVVCVQPPRRLVGRLAESGRGF